ncbi:MAG: flippase-like domain-containing protein [Methanocorpusculum parvum]|nr:flippase-like domain-containing protein [Methanocorpusculum parvum]
MDAKYRKLLWISIGLSLGIMLLVILFTFDEETLVALKNFDYRFLLLAFGLHLFAIVFWGMRIVVLCRSLGYRVTLRHCINMAAAGQLLAAITPSSIGGEPVRVHELYKARVPLADATAVVLVERLLEGVLLVIGVICGMTAFSLVYRNGEIPSEMITAAWIGTAFFSAVLLVLILIMRKPELVKKRLVGILGFAGRKMRAERMQKLEADLAAGVDQFYGTFRHFAGKEGRIGLFLALLLSLALWTCEYAVASVIMMGLGYAPHILLSIIFQMIIAVIFMIPLTPGGTGVAELCYAGFYALILPTGVIGLFVVLLRAILYYSNLLIGFIATFLIVRREARNEEVDFCDEE